MSETHETNAAFVKRMQPICDAARHDPGGKSGHRLSVTSDFDGSETHAALCNAEYFDIVSRTALPRALGIINKLRDTIIELHGTPENCDAAEECFVCEALK